MRSRVLVDLKATVLEFKRSPSAVFWTLAFPILLILIFGAIYSGGGPGTYNLHVQDLDGSFESQQLLEGLNASDLVEVKMVGPDRDPEKVISDGGLTSFLIIPSGFGANLSAGENATLEFRMDAGSQAALTNYNVVKSVADSMNLAVQGSDELIEIEDTSIVSQQLRFIDFFVPGVLALTIMNSTVNYMVITITEYKNHGLFRKMMTTPLRRSEWLASRILWQVILAFVSVAIIMGIGIMLFDVQLSINIMAILLLLAGTALFTALGMAIAGLISDEQAAGAVAGAVVFPMMFLSGIFFQLEAMPGYLQTVAMALPLTYLVEGLRDAMIYGNMAGAAYNLAVVSGLAVVFAVLGTALTKWKQE